MELLSFLLFGGSLALVVGMVTTSQKQKQSAGSAQPTAEMQAVLDELAALGPQPLEKLHPDEARRQPTPGDAVLALLKKRGQSTEHERVGGAKELEIPGAAGPIAARHYIPNVHGHEGGGPFPIVMYWHGGGWVLADLDDYDASCRALCNASRSVVVSCHYRQAPEHPFPAAIEDAFAAYQWVVDNASALGGKRQLIAVAGESAGGNLAAVTAMQARDYGAKLPVHQLLIYPVTNHGFDSPSYREHAQAVPLNADMMRWFWRHYLDSDEDAHNPYASPLQAGRFDGLPPATILTADIDPLRSDGQQYAEKLQAAGVEVTYQNYPGMTHEFFGMTAVLHEARDAVELAARELQASCAKK